MGPMNSIDKAQILAAAIAFLDENGLPELSMRRLAAELGVGTMTLYTHVPNKEALLNEIVQAILEDIQIPAEPDQPWSEKVRSILHSFRGVAHKHPSVIQLIPINPPWTAPALRATEVGVAALREAGFDDKAAAHAYRTLASYVVGYVSLELGGFFAVDEARAPDANFPFDDFPNLLAAAPYLADWDPEREFDLGIDLILAGLENRLRPSRRAKTRKKPSRTTSGRNLGKG